MGGLVRTALGAAFLTAAAAAQELPRHVTPEVASAAASGLSWLAAGQKGNGSWDAGPGGTYPVAMTSLAGLAFVAGGNTPTRGPHGPRVRAAVEWLLARQDDGLFLEPNGRRTMYGHGYAMLFLAEVHGMTGAEDGERDQRLDDRIRRALLDATRATEAVQNESGGWPYESSPGPDEGSVTVTQVQGLRACMDVGIDVPIEVVRRSFRYLETCQNADGGIRYRAGQTSQARPAITAAACAALHYLSNEDTAVGERTWAYVRANLFGEGLEGPWSRSWFYYGHFYLAQAVYMRDAAAWDEYYPVARDLLLERQNPDGSWPGDGTIGPVCGTSFALLVLQLPYARLPILNH